MNIEAERGKGEELVFINPVISRPKGVAEAEEGCLSLPELYGPVKRPKQVNVQAYNLSGEEFAGQVDGLFARVIQHETDHLDGVMFTDRMSEGAKLNAQPALEEFEVEFQSKRNTGEIPTDEEIATRLADLEERYC